MISKRIECPECKQKQAVLVDTSQKKYDCAFCRCFFSMKKNSSQILTHGTTYRK